VLTSFAGIDISFGEGGPAFFETRMLDGVDKLDCIDTATWNEAFVGHHAMMTRLLGWAARLRTHPYNMEHNCYGA